ncbi:hypothetical protein VF21_04472 [Pseudogymnoascus sp. 05NY08]|nr:hypothetical protein VF21_04472 [Pseudogymnoascus sp. 05NY08]
MVDTATQSVKENWPIQRQIPDIATSSQHNPDVQQELDGFQSFKGGGRRVLRQDNYLNIISTRSPPTADAATQRDEENGLVQRPPPAIVPAIPADQDIQQVLNELRDFRKEVADLRAEVQDSVSTKKLLVQAILESVNMENMRKKACDSFYFMLYGYGIINVGFAILDMGRGQTMQ